MPSERHDVWEDAYRKQVRSTKGSPPCWSPVPRLTSLASSRGLIVRVLGVERPALYPEFPFSASWGGQHYTPNRLGHVFILTTTNLPGRGPDLACHDIGHKQGQRY